MLLGELPEDGEVLVEAAVAEEVLPLEVRGRRQAPARGQRRQLLEEPLDEGVVVGREGELEQPLEGLLAARVRWPRATISPKWRRAEAKSRRRKWASPRR